MKPQLHMPPAHSDGPAGHRHKGGLASRLGKAEGAFDYIVIAGIVILGLAMAIGLMTAAG